MEWDASKRFPCQLRQCAMLPVFIEAPFLLGNEEIQINCPKQVFCYVGALYTFSLPLRLLLGMSIEQRKNRCSNRMPRRFWLQHGDLRARSSLATLKIVVWSPPRRY